MCKRLPCQPVVTRRPDTSGVRRAQTLYKISPNLADNVSFGKLTWFQNKPQIASNTQAFVSVSATALNVQPCLIRFSPIGASC